MAKIGTRFSFIFECSLGTDCAEKLTAIISAVNEIRAQKAPLFVRRVRPSWYFGDLWRKVDTVRGDEYGIMKDD